MVAHSPSTAPPRAVAPTRPRSGTSSVRENVDEGSRVISSQRSEVTAVSDREKESIPTDASEQEESEGQDGGKREGGPKEEHASDSPLSSRRRAALIAIVAFTTVMSSGGQMGLNIALPVIQKELNMRDSNLQWIASAYALTFGCLLLLAGRLADVYGRKLCFILGIGWYALWNLVGGFMHSGSALIVTRALAGGGAAMGIPASMGLIAANIHGKQRATAFAVFGAGAPIGGAMGMTLGGVMTAFTSHTWRPVLWIFTGLATLIAVAAVFVVPPDWKKKRAKGEPKPEADKVDWLGAVLITSGLVLVQFTISDGMNAPKGWRSPYVPTLFCIGVIFVTLFFFWEYHVIHRTPRAPLLRLALFTRGRGRLSAMYFVGFVMWAGFQGIGYHATLYFQQVQMTGTIGALLRTLPAPISGLICNFILAKVVHYIPGQFLICIGLGATGLSGTFFAVSSRTQNYWTFPFNAMWLWVVGADFLMPAGSIFVSRMALPQEQSVAGALFQTLLQLGGSFGLTFTTVIGTSVSDRSRALDPVDAHLEGLHASFWLSAALCYTAMLLAAVTLHGIGIVSRVVSEEKQDVEGGRAVDVKEKSGDLVENETK